MDTLPALFVSHGAPTFALEPGLVGAQLRALGRALGKPCAIVIVSPHWNEHFLPLLVALGASPEGAPATVLDGGIRDSVLAMESYVFGRELPIEVEAQEVAA